MEPTVRNVRVDEIKVKVCGRIAVCVQDCVKWLHLILLRGWEIVCDWGTFPLLHCKQNVGQSALQAMLIGPPRWEPVRLPEPIQCGIQARELVGTNSL